MRQERIDNKPMKGFDYTIFMAMKGLKFEDTSGSKRQSAASKRADIAIQKEQDKELGIKKRSPAKKGRGASRGG